MNIAFWGGCINRQQNMSSDKHYHAIVRNGVAIETVETPKIRLRFYSSFYELKKESIQMLQRDTQYDYLVIFLRPYTLMPLTKLLIRYTDNNMQQKLVLNPRFSSARYYDNMVKEYKVTVQNKGDEGLLHKAFQKLNDIAGDILGLQEWAHLEVIGMLGEINAAASVRNTKLILLGPPLYPANPRISKSCIELNRKIAAFAAANNIGHVDMVVSAIEDEYIFSKPDGKHINEAGHNFMAKGILECLQVPEEKLTNSDLF